DRTMPTMMPVMSSDAMKAAMCSGRRWASRHALVNSITFCQETPNNRVAGFEACLARHVGRPYIAGAGGAAAIRRGRGRSGGSGRADRPTPRPALWPLRPPEAACDCLVGADGRRLEFDP